MSLDRLWADWRSDYVSHPDTGRTDRGCVLCNLVNAEDDAEALVLERTDHTITVMNLYPYGSGHLMVAPIRHVASFLDLTLWGGASTNSSTRAVANNLVPTGLESATASYSGTFFTPEIAYGWHIQLGDGVVLIPAARLRYVAGWFGGYTETGSMQGLTVGSRTVQDLEERLEAMVSKSGPTPWGAAIEAHATLGVLGLERVGGNNVSSTLIGVPLSFAVPGQSDVFGGYVGTGLDLHVTPSTTVFSSADFTVYSDKSRTGMARGGVRVSF